jgi:LCP family protein required for cell wall assembly
MYYEPYRPKRRPSCLGRLFRIALILAVLWAVMLLVTRLPLSFNLPLVNGTVSLDGLLPSGYTDILLLGADNEVGRGRTDTIIVASIGKGEIKLTSIMRDTLVNIEGYGKHKINAAYRFGGEKTAMQTVNKAFGLNITRYAVIGFEGFSNLIDSVGGVAVSVSKAEMQEINKGLDATWKRLGGGRPIEYLTTYGEKTHLNGPQALAFARIRKIDSDYKRASRQRAVLEALFFKLRTTKNPLVFMKLLKTALSTVKTNMSVFEIGLLGAQALTGGMRISQFRLPAEGAYTTGTEDGAWVIKPDLAKNRQLLQEFLNRT